MTLCWADKVGAVALAILMALLLAISNVGSGQGATETQSGDCTVNNPQGDARFVWDPGPLIAPAGYGNCPIRTVRIEYPTGIAYLELFATILWQCGRYTVLPFWLFLRLVDLLAGGPAHRRGRVIGHILN